MTTTRLELALEFAAAHEVGSPQTGCSGLHGHNFRLRVTLEAPIDPRTGAVADVPRVQSLLRELVFVPLDHRSLNDTIENPTLERVATHVFDALSRRLADLAQVSLEDGLGRCATVTR